MKVYKMGFGHSICFLLLTLVLVCAGDVGLSRLLPPPVDPKEVNELAQQVARLPAYDRQQLFDRVMGRGTASPDELLAGDRARTIQERHAAIQRIYANLETRRAALKPEDKAALAAYTRDETRYQQLLTALQKDAVAAAGSQPPKP